MEASLIFEALKVHLHARNWTYKDVARHMKLSEPTVKRMFAKGDATVERLLEVCHLLQVEFPDLIRSLPRKRKYITHLTWAQEEDFVKNKHLLLMAICIMNYWPYEEIVRRVKFTAAECTKLLCVLEKMGFIELYPNNHYRSLLAQHFSWIADGPIMRFVKTMSPEFFDHPFDGDGEVLRIINVRISVEAAKKLKSRLEKIAQEYCDRVATDSHLPIEQRPPVSVCVATRNWIPKHVRDLLRQD